MLSTPHNYLIPDDVKTDLETFTVPDVLAVYGGQEYDRARTAIDEVIANSANQDAFTNAINQLFMVLNPVHMSLWYQDCCLQTAYPGGQSIMYNMLFTYATDNHIYAYV